jgi:hypothetical protein
VQHVFGVLQSRRAIVRHPARTWNTERVWGVKTACVCTTWSLMTIVMTKSMAKAGKFRVIWLSPRPTSWEEFMYVHHTLCDKITHDRFQADLTEHI